MTLKFHVHAQSIEEVQSPLPTKILEETGLDPGLVKNIFRNEIFNNNQTRFLFLRCGMSGKPAMAGGGLCPAPDILPIQFLV